MRGTGTRSRRRACGAVGVKLGLHVSAKAGWCRCSERCSIVSAAAQGQADSGVEVAARQHRLARGAEIDRVRLRLTSITVGIRRSSDVWVSSARRRANPRLDEQPPGAACCRRFARTLGGHHRRESAGPRVSARRSEIVDVGPFVPRAVVMVALVFERGIAPDKSKRGPVEAGLRVRQVDRAVRCPLLITCDGGSEQSRLRSPTATSAIRRADNGNPRPPHDASSTRRRRDPAALGANASSTWPDRRWENG